MYYDSMSRFVYLFLTLDHGKTLNIQTVTIKKKKKHVLAVIYPVLFQFSVNINKQPQKLQSENKFWNKVPIKLVPFKK